MGNPLLSFYNIVQVYTCTFNINATYFICDEGERLKWMQNSSTFDISTIDPCMSLHHSQRELTHLLFNTPVNRKGHLLKTEGFLVGDSKDGQCEGIQTLVDMKLHDDVVVYVELEVRLEILPVLWDPILQDFFRGQVGYPLPHHCKYSKLKCFHKHSHKVYYWPIMYLPTSSMLNENQLVPSNIVQS
ncbi:ORF3 [Bactrocera dorsalis borna-like virus]|nr:ORF3 [Bactrocera dorsalis borna-like virus]